MADTNKNMIMDDIPPSTENIYNINYMYMADFDGDGLVDLLTALSPDPWHSTASYIQMTTFQHFDSRIGQTVPARYFRDVDVSGANFTNGQGNVAFPDFNYRSLLVSPYNFNGGLKQELIVVNKHKTYVYSFARQGNDFYISELFNAGYPTEWHRTTLGDFNGDGNTDLLVRLQNQNNWEIAYSTGTGFDVKRINLCEQPNTYYPTSSHLSPDNTLIITADINNDGLSDISYINAVRNTGANIRHSNKLIINYNKGNGVFDCQYKDFLTSADSLYPVRGEHQLLGDFNGDGKLDILWNVGTNINGAGFSAKKYMTVGQFKNEYTLRSVRNGLGTVNHIKYLPLNTTQDVNHYHFSGHLSNSWPLNRLKIPLWTVQKIGRHTSNTANVTSEVYYRYEDLHALRDGRGMLGFGVTFTHELVTGAIKKSYNGSFAPYGRYLPDYTGTEEGYIVGSNYTVLRHTDNYRRYQQVIPGKTYSLQEYRNIQVDSQSHTRIITNTTFDNSTNNNPIEIKTEYPGLFTTVKKIAYAPAADTRTTLPSRPKSVEEISTRQGLPSVTTKAKYEYQNGHLYKQTIHDGLPNAITTTYVYDNFGNTTSQTVSAAGVPSRTELYEYDSTHRFRTKTANALGQAVNTKYDSHWGVVTEQKAFGGLTTGYEYDPFLRRKKTTFPEGFSITENLFWEGGVNTINDARYRKETNDPAKGVTKFMFNVFGQLLEERGNLWNQSGIVILYNKGINYDAVGRKVFETSVTGFNDPNNIHNYYSYDRQGRIREIKSIYDNISSINQYITGINYSYISGNLKTETTKPSGAVIYTITDPTGKVIESKDENGVVKFAYDSWGNTWKTLLLNIPVVTNTYDVYNLHREVSDLSAGNTTYEYDALGQLIKQKDPLQQQTTFEYDLLGRKKSVAFPEGKLTYGYYNDSNHPKGNQLRSELRADAGGVTEEKREYMYDNYGRVEKANYTQANLSPRATSYGYDNLGRVASTILSSGVNYTTEYNTGALWRVKQNNTLIFEVKEINGHGQPIEILRGDGLTSTHTYECGQLLRKVVPGFQDYELSMDWSRDLITRRRDHLANRHEDFTYDALKLATATVGANGPITPLPPQTQVYGTNSLTKGNLLNKSDIGDFSYAQHKLYYTDNTAGAIPAQRQDITYASYKRPLTIKENGREARIEYGTDGERRVMRCYANGALQYSKHYLPDGVEVIQDRFGVVHTITPLPGADGVGAYVVTKDDPSNPLLLTSNNYYPYTDHLGSITLLTETDLWGNAVVAHRQAFDPWGRRRNPTTWETDDNALPLGTMRRWLRGFTGHEHLDDYGLINMNARLYDPKLGRMLSPDVLIGAPGSPLGYNRYVYALNNPISNIDPTGNEPITLTAVLIGAAIGAAVAGTAYTLQTTTMPGGLQKNWNIGEFLKSTAIGAASGAASGAIGSAFGGTGSLINGTFSLSNELGRAAAHGITGAFFSGAQGGDPLTGFVTSFLSTGISHGLEGAGAAALTSGVGGAAFNAGMGAAFSYMQGGDPWIGAAGSLIGFLANQNSKKGEKQEQQKVRNQTVKDVSEAYSRGTVVVVNGITYVVDTKMGRAMAMGGNLKLLKHSEKVYLIQEARHFNKVGQGMAKTIGVAGLAVNAVDGLYNGVSTSLVIDAGMNAVGIWGGVPGAIANGIYFIGNEGLKIYTGRDLGQNIDYLYNKYHK